MAIMGLTLFGKPAGGGVRGLGGGGGGRGKG